MDKGLKILLKAYWSSNGWKDGTISKEDFEIAKQEGYMFDYPSYETHDEALNRLNALLAQINPEDVANAFLYSLSTRRLEYRSPLGSYYYAKAIPEHTLQADENPNHCYLCGWYGWKENPDEYDLKRGLNILNFDHTIQCLNSWIGHSSHCNSYKLQQKVLKSCEFLVTNNTFEKIENELINMIESEP